MYNTCSEEFETWDTKNMKLALNTVAEKSITNLSQNIQMYEYKNNTFLIYKWTQIYLQTQIYWRTQIY